MDRRTRQQVKRLRPFFEDPDADFNSLSETDKKMILLINICYPLINSLRKKDDILTKLVELAKMQGHSLSDMAAYRIFAATQVLFGEVAVVSRKFAAEQIFEDLQEAYMMAREAGDYKVMITALKARTEAVDKFAPEDAPDFADLQVEAIMLTANPEHLGIELMDKKELDAELKKLLAPKNKIQIKS